MISPGLPHHRHHPRIDERRDDPAERTIIGLAVAIAYVAGVVLLVAFAFSVI